MSRNRLSRLTFFERLLSGVTSVRPGEGHFISLMLMQIFLLLHAYYLIRPLRDSLILAEGSPEIRAYATGAIAVALIFLIPLYKVLFDRLDGNGGKATILTWIGAFFVTNLLLFAFMVWQGVPVAVPFYIWVGLFSVMVVAQFWAFAADLLNVKTGQRLFTVVMIGAAMGAASGSQVAGRLHSVLGTPGILLLAAALLTFVILLSTHSERSVPEGSRSTSPPRPNNGTRGLSEVLGGFSVVANSRYLLLIAMFVMIVNFVNSTGGYILSTFVTQHANEMAASGAATRGEVFDRFYGNFYSTVSLLQLGIQLFLVSRIFRWFGIRGAILVLPLVMLLNYGLIAMVPVFALVRLMMIVESSAMYSIHSTTSHALYLPVTRMEKYVGKTTIDTFFWRFGDLLYAGMIFVTAQVMGWPVASAIIINVVLAVVLLAIGTAIGKQHRTQTRQNADNLPPELTAPLPDVYIPAGQLLTFSIPDNAFMDPDPGDTLNFQAWTAGGKPLPNWVKFDRYNQTFTVRPPGGGEGQIDVELIATDFEGLSVEARFQIAYGLDPVPRFANGDEAG